MNRQVGPGTAEKCTLNGKEQGTTFPVIAFSLSGYFVFKIEWIKLYVVSCQLNRLLLLLEDRSRPL